MLATESPAPGPRHIVEHGLDWTGMFNSVHALQNDQGVHKAKVD